jgi:hypothetical protein
MTMRAVRLGPTAPISTQHIHMMRDRFQMIWIDATWGAAEMI